MRNIVRHIRQSLSWKLSLGILLMAIPIFMLALGILFVQSRNKVKREATKYAESIVNTTMQRIHRYMNIAETATELTACDVMANLHPDSLFTYTSYVVTMNNYVDGCSVSLEPETFPQYGRYFSVYSVHNRQDSLKGMRDTIITAIEEKYEYFSRVWYKQPKREGKACWTAFYDESDSLALALDGMVISYCKPLYRDDKSLLGIISTDLSLLRLSKTFTSETSFADSYFFMIGDEGRFYLHPDSAQLFTKTIFTGADPDKNPDIIALGHQMTTGQQGSMSVKIKGVPCIVSYQPVPDTNWSLALVTPERTLLRSYNLLAYIVSALLIIGLVLILFFSSFIVTHAIRPLYNLAKKLQRIADGHYDETIERTRHRDVVGRLQNSFAIMQASLDRHVSDIRKMNIEAERRNEELARISELAKESTRQKSLFIQNVSHQIRTPLNIIMGFSQVLKENKGAISADEAKGITDMMRHNAQMLDRMVLMLFDSSARGITEEVLMLFDSSARGITEETYANRDEEVLCNELAHYCIDETLKQFPEMKIQLLTDVSDDFHIHTSYLYLMRSVRELLFNAVKYSDGQHIVMRINRTEDTVRFIFEDTGPGIAEEDAARLFEMFVKVNDLSEGLGIGLPLAKRHLKNLGGDITLDTSYKAGCRFIIELPIGE